MRSLLIANCISCLLAACRQAGTVDTSPSNTLERMQDKDSLVILLNTRSCSSDASSKLVIHKEKETWIADYYKLHDKSVYGNNVDYEPAGKLTHTAQLDSNDRAVFKRFVRELLHTKTPSCTIFTVYTVHSPYWNTEVTADECFKNGLNEWFPAFFGAITRAH